MYPNQRARVLAKRRIVENLTTKKVSDLPPGFWGMMSEYSKAVMNLIDMMPITMKNIANETGQIDIALQSCPREYQILLRNAKFRLAAAKLAQLNDRIGN